MSIDFDENDDILGTPFYVTHTEDAVWIGVMTPYGVLAQPVDSDDWKDWVRRELTRCHPSEIPKAFLEMK